MHCGSRSCRLPAEEVVLPTQHSPILQVLLPVNPENENKIMDKY
jgi:hypothetical protein